MSLVTHARTEMEKAGLFNKDTADYDGMVGEAVMELVEKFAAQGHSGMSADLTLFVFSEVARFRALTPLTSNPDEWMNVSEASGGNPMWQSRRQCSVFSRDGGQTWYDLDAPTGEAKPEG